MVWFTGRASKSYYDYPYAVHFFTNRRLSCETVLKKSIEILRGADIEGLVSRFVGYEELPLHIPISQEYHIAVEFKSTDFGNYRLNIIASNIDNSVAEEVARHRMSYLTVDIDEYKPRVASSTLEELATAIDVASESMAEEVRVFRTRGGYHIRAKLKAPLGFEKLMELRQKAWDDPERVRIDYLYHEHGLTFLTNLLFNEKCVASAFGKFTCFEEREVPLEDVTIAREVYNFGFDPLHRRTLRLSVDQVEATVNYRVVLHGRPSIVTKELTSKVRKEIERMYNNEEAVATLSKAYGDAKTFGLRSVRVVDLGYVVYILAPRELMGSLIGRGGTRVRNAERVLGKRVVVVDRDNSKDVAEVYTDLVRTAVRRALST
jgi:hypothetical protein